MRRDKWVVTLALLALFVVYGCSSRPVEWEHRQYPRPLSAEARERLARDRYECERVNYSDPRLTRLCLEARGWFQVPK